jgi:DNA-binding transcriptional ArsR family regulator
LVEYPQTLSRTFLALSDPTRRDILSRLEGKESTVTEIAAPYAMSLNAVSKHLRVLESAGLIRRRIEGRVHWLTAEGQPLADAAVWVNYHASFWDERLDAPADSIRQRKKRR